MQSSGVNCSPPYTCMLSLLCMQVASHSAVNKMTAENLASTIGVNLLRKSEAIEGTWPFSLPLIRIEGRISGVEHMRDRNVLSIQHLCVFLVYARPLTRVCVYNVQPCRCSGWRWSAAWCWTSSAPRPSSSTPHHSHNHRHNHRHRRNQGALRFIPPRLADVYPKTTMRSSITESAFVPLSCLN